jgi:hypothetical protein
MTEQYDLRDLSTIEDQLPDLDESALTLLIKQLKAELE